MIVKRPYEYLQGAVIKSVLPPSLLETTKLLTFTVGSDQFRFLASNNSLLPAAGIALEDYKIYIRSKEPKNAALVNHELSYVKQSTLSFHPHRTTSSRGYALVGSSIFKREIDDITYGASIRKLIGDLVSIFTAWGAYPAMNNVTGVANLAIELTKAGYPNIQQDYRYADAANWIPVGAQGGANGYIINYIPRAPYGGMISGLTCSIPSSATQLNILCNKAFLLSLGIDFSRIGVALTKNQGTPTGVNEDNQSNTVAQMYTRFPMLQVFANNVAMKLGVSLSSLHWGAPTAGAAQFLGFELFVDGYLYTNVKSESLGRAVFEFDTLSTDAIVGFFNFQYTETQLSPPLYAVTIPCLSLGCSYDLDKLVDAMDSSATEIKSFVAANPGSAVIYTQVPQPFFPIADKVLEGTSLYKRAVESNFDLYAEIVMTSPQTVTIKQMSNIVNAKVGVENAIAIVRTKYFPTIAVGWTYENYKLATWSVDANGILSGTYAGITVFLDYRNTEHRDDIEFVYFLGCTITYATSELDYLNSAFSVSTRAALLATYASTAIPISSADMELSPTVLSPNGMMHKANYTDDVWRRLYFVQSYLSSADLVLVVKGALVAHFNW